MSASDKKFIAELMPRYPIYIFAGPSAGDLASEENRYAGEGNLIQREASIKGDLISFSTI